MWTFSLLMFFIFVVIGVASGLTPFYSRQSAPFGVSIGVKDPYIETRKKRYAFWNVLGSVILGVPVFFFTTFENREQVELWSSIYVLIAMIALLLLSGLLYLKYRKDIQEWKKRLPKEERMKSKKIIIDASYHEKLHTRGNISFFAWQFVIVLITVAIIFSFYDRIPKEIPIHWGSDFQVNRTIEKSFWGVLSLPMMQLFLIPVFNYSNYSIVNSKQKLSPLDPAQASGKSRRFREAWSGFLFLTTIGTQLMLSFLVLFSMFSQGKFTWLLIAVIVLFLLFTIGGSLYLTVKYGQAGEKLLSEEERYYEDPDEEDNWLLGVIYFNKDDPSVFVEKRFGIGTTVNMARWQAWLAVVSLILFTVVMLIWSLLME